MSSDYRTYVTQTGFGLEAQAKQAGTGVFDGSVWFVIGDTLLDDESNPASQEDLLNQVRSYGATIEPDEDDPTIWIARVEIPANDGGFFIREAGIRVGDRDNGYLYCYARQGGDYKPNLEEGQGKSYTIRLKFIPGNASVINAKIDPSVQFATPTDLSNAITAHKAEADPHAQYLTRADFLKHMLFKGAPMSVVGPAPDPDIWLPAGRVELLRADYPTVFEIVSASAFFTDQATIDADPRAYAGHWGTGDGATTFTTDDWALMMNIKVAGGYGAAGSTKEDHIQNITGGYDSRRSQSSDVGTTYPIEDNFSGAFEAGSNSGIGVAQAYIQLVNQATPSREIIFDASLVARTDTYTDTMGLFLDHYRVIPKGVFSYA